MNVRGSAVDQTGFSHSAISPTSLFLYGQKVRNLASIFHPTCFMSYRIEVEPDI